MAATIDFKGNAENVENTDVYTFADADLGAAASDRQIIVGISWPAQDVVSVTIGGVTATLVTDVYSGISAVRNAFYKANVPTGTTGDIVVTLNGATARMGICWWRATGINSA